MERYDAIIVGGGPAGLNAALVLGRCNRRVLLVDAGFPRNFASRHAHNYLTRDGIDPKELLALGREEVERYGVQVRRDLAVEAACLDPGFRVRLKEGGEFTARLLLLATGVRDELPKIPDFSTFYGVGIHHCPYCDAHPYTGKRIAAYGAPQKALGLALNLLTWSPHLHIVTNGEAIPNRLRKRAAFFGIGWCEEPIAALEAAPGEPGPDGRRALAGIRFASASRLGVDALFFNTGQAQRSELAERLGCVRNKEGGLQRDQRQRTNVKGLFVAGDASRDVQFVIVAAAEGARAGVAMNAELQRQDRDEHLRAARSAPDTIQAAFTQRAENNSR